jgi:hypothetical protein
MVTKNISRCAQPAGACAQAARKKQGGSEKEEAGFPFFSLGSMASYASLICERAHMTINASVSDGRTQAHPITKT